MKHTLLIIVALVVCFKSQAQLSKGRMMLSGSFNYSKNYAATTDTGVYAQQPINNSNSFTGTIRYGYFVTDKIAVGVYGSYTHSGNNSNSNYFNGTTHLVQTSNRTANNFSAGVFSRYYQMLGKSRFALFGELFAGYGMGKQEQKVTSLDPAGNLVTTNSHSDLSSINLGFNPGLVFFVTKHLAIETTFGSAGFSAQRSKNYSPNQYNETKNSTFNTNLGLSISRFTWGVNFYFGGKKEKTEVPTK